MPQTTTAEDELTESTTALPPRTTVGDKRKHRDVAIQDSAYFKMIGVVQQLRPYFIEVLQTPDFRNCEASYQIRKRMKVFMDLYKQTQIEGNPVRINAEDNSHDCQPISNEKKKPTKECPEAVCIPPPQQSDEHDQQQVEEINVVKKSPAKKKSQRRHSSSSSVVEKLKDIQPRGSYIVGGGSVASSKFVMFVNRKPPEYYGVTKELYRASDRRLKNGILQLETADPTTTP